MHVLGVFVHANHVKTTPTACLPFQILDAAEVIGETSKTRGWQKLRSLMPRNGTKCTAWAYLGPNPGFFAFCHHDPHLAALEYE